MNPPESVASSYFKLLLYIRFALFDGCCLGGTSQRLAILAHSLSFAGRSGYRSCSILFAFLNEGILGRTSQFLFSGFRIAGRSSRSGSQRVFFTLGHEAVLGSACQLFLGCLVCTGCSKRSVGNEQRGNGSNDQITHVSLLSQLLLMVTNGGERSATARDYTVTACCDGWANSGPSAPPSDASTGRARCSPCPATPAAIPLHHSSHVPTAMPSRE